MRQRLRVAAGSDYLPEYFWQGRGHNLRARQGARIQRLPHPERTGAHSHPNAAQGRPFRRENPRRKGSGAQNDRGNRPDARRSGKNVGPGTGRSPDLRARHRRLDRRDVPDLPSWTPRRFADPRLWRAERVCPHVWKAAHPEAERASEIWRALASLPHRRELVHVARRRTGRQGWQEANQSEWQARRERPDERGRKSAILYRLESWSVLYFQ